MTQVFDQHGNVTAFEWTTPDATDPISKHSPIFLAVSSEETAEHLRFADTRVGLWFEPNDEPLALPHEWLQNVDTIAIHFPTFMDGRGFSIARLLRERLHFKGPLMAVGDVILDQVSYLHRCGFSHVCLPDSVTAEDYLACSSPFSHSYQTI